MGVPGELAAGARRLPRLCTIAALLAAGLAAAGSLLAALYANATGYRDSILEEADSQSTRHLLVLANQLLALANLTEEGAGYREARPVLLSISSEADSLAWIAGLWYDATGDGRFATLQQALKRVASWALRAYNDPDYYRARVLGDPGLVAELAVTVDDMFNSYLRISMVPAGAAGELAAVASRLG